MTTFEITDAKPWHVGQMSRILRIEHQKALAVFGIEAHRELRQVFDQSIFTRAWLVDGKLGAIFGIVGSSLERSGFLWVAISELGKRYPVEIIKESRRQLAYIMSIKKELVTAVIGGDDAAMRFAVFMGFQAMKDGRGSRGSSRFARRDLINYIANTPEIRVTQGKGFAVALNYTSEA